MLVQRLRRWPNMKPRVDQPSVCAGIVCYSSRRDLNLITHLIIKENSRSNTSNTDKLDIIPCLWYFSAQIFSLYLWQAFNYNFAQSSIFLFILSSFIDLMVCRYSYNSTLYAPITTILVVILFTKIFESGIFKVGPRVIKTLDYDTFDFRNLNIFTLLLTDPLLTYWIQLPLQKPWKKGFYVYVEPLLCY